LSLLGLSCAVLGAIPHLHLKGIYHGYEQQTRF